MARPGQRRDPHALRVPINMGETEQLVQWATEDEFFVRAANLVHAELFLLHPYRIRVDDVDVTEAYPFFRSPAFARALAEFMKEALFYAHLFPVVVFKVQKNISQWLLALGQAPADSRGTIQLPVAVQPLLAREGQLVYHCDRRTNERYYTWTPRNADDHQHWDFYCPVHMDDVMSPEPVPPPVWMVERDQAAAAAAAASGAAPAGMGMSPLTVTPLPMVSLASSASSSSSVASSSLLLPSLFRVAYKEALDLAQYRRNMNDAESELAHPHVFMLTRPMREVLPESLSANDLLGTERLGDASTMQAVRRQAEATRFLVRMVDQYRSQAEAARTDLDPADTPQAEHRRQHGLMDVMDQRMVLPESVASVHMPAPAYRVDVAAETQRYARSMALRFGNLPADDVLGSDMASGGTSDSSASVRTRGYSPAETRYKEREHAMERKRRLAADIWSTVYNMAFARHDLAGLADILFTLDENQYTPRARQLTDAVRRARQTSSSSAAAATATDDHDEGGGDSAAAADSGERRFNTKNARRVLTAAVRGVSELSDRVAVPTLRELRDEITARLEAFSFPTSTIEFETVDDAVGNLQDHELLPHTTQEMRFHTLQLVQKAATDGIIEAKSFATTAKRLFGFDLKSQELPAGGKANAKDGGGPASSSSSDRPAKKQRTE